MSVDRVLSLIGAALTGVVSAISVFIKMRQQLTDHIKECDRRYCENAQQMDRLEQKLDRLIERQTHPQSRGPS